jgi:hypothetical protein
MVMKIIKEDLLQQQRQREMELRFMRMQGVHLRMAPPVDTFDAAKLFDEGVRIIKDTSIPWEERGKWGEQHLSSSGWALLQDFANSDSEEVRAGILKILANAEEAYKFTKDGLPKYMVEVTKQKGKAHKIILVDRFHPEKTYEVTFKSATSRVVYLWFLLNAGKEIHHYVSIDTFLKDFYYDLKGREPKNFNWEHSITDAKKALIDALKYAGEDKEDRIAPYVIDNNTFDQNNMKVYCLKLPQVLIDTSVLESGSTRALVDYRYEDIIA